MKIVIILCIIILFSEAVLSLQDHSSSEKYKHDAISKINNGQYGEAIDLLNKFISDNPQNSSGYTLRASCYEARGQYEHAVYDLRSATKLNRDDLKLEQSLSRVTEVWYTQLYNKIEGHKREIAFYPDKAVNYLEIGKCYKNLGNWTVAEEWHDKYLRLEDPSPDEVIRYTEILAKNNHITKGELILKKFVEKYPDDHRLWSRYGYFTLWLGKNKLSISAFSEALQFRPFFKEAIDGLNLAQGKGSVYTVNDTTYRFNKLTGQFQKSKTREYPIDKYFKILKRDPSNDSVRILLLHDLLNVNRFEEAKQQFELLKKRHPSDEFYLTGLNNEITDKWNLFIDYKIKDLSAKLRAGPSNRKVLQELVNFYALSNNVDSIISVCQNYLSLNPNENEIRHDYAKKLSWFKNFDIAKEQVEYLLDKYPDRMEYQLLRAQIAVWTNTDLDYAKVLLSKVLEKGPNNLEVLSILAELNYQTQNFALSKVYISRIEKINPEYVNIKELKNNLLIQQKRFDESQLDSLLNDARNFLIGKKCTEAVKAFEEYLSKTNSVDGVNLELANAYICSKDYKNAIKIYSGIIEKKYDYDLAKLRAKTFFWNGDYLNALKEFKSLNSFNSDDAEVKLFLADSYFELSDYINAKKIYSQLSDESPSSLMLKSRLSWLPHEVVTDGSFSSFITNFPSYTLVTPEAYFFKDNLSFKYNLQGIRAEIGTTKFLSFGGAIYRGDLSSDSAKQKFYTIIGNLNLIPNKSITASFSFGQVNYLDNQKQNISELSLKSEVKDKYFLIGRYKSSDASQVLYSPFLVDSLLRVTDYSVEGNYVTPTELILSGLYSFKQVSDDNKGSQLILKLGRKFSKDFVSGYEYHYLDYDIETPIYYSPEKFESHSLWADYNIIQDNVMDLSIGGKVGLIPKSDLLAKEFNTKLSLKLFDSLTLQAQAVFSENSRELVNYSSTSISIMAFWIF